MYLSYMFFQTFLLHLILTYLIFQLTMYNLI